MSILVVGGDRLGKIPAKLSKLGFNKIEHIAGRKCQNCKMRKKMDMVLVLTDYVNHNLCEAVKVKAKSNQIPILFCRRSWACIYKKLNFYGLIS